MRVVRAAGWLIAYYRHRSCVSGSVSSGASVLCPRHPVRPGGWSGVNGNDPPGVPAGRGGVVGVGSGGRIRTSDLWVMSPTSCHCSTPRHASAAVIVVLAVGCARGGLASHTVSHAVLSGAVAGHDRVRDGTGWSHNALGHGHIPPSDSVLSHEQGRTWCRTGPTAPTTKSTPPGLCQNPFDH